MILKKVDQEVDHKVVVADGIPSSRPKPIQVEAGSSLPMATRVVVGYSPRVVYPVGLRNHLPVALPGLAGNHLPTGILVEVGNSQQIPTLVEASTKNQLTMRSKTRTNLVRAS